MRGRGLAAATVLVVLCGGSAAVAQPTTAESGARVARNIIYIQGDGLGLGQRDLLRLALKGKRGELAMDGLAVTGLVRTSSDDEDEIVTDSAAAATALATGHKTRNGAVGMDVHGRPVETILERAKRAGKSTGLVTTAQVTGASPAAFAAHVPSRDSQSDIAKQYIENSRPDVLLGGGEDWWYPKGNPGLWPDKPGEESRSPYGDLVERARRIGYTYVRDGDELRNTRANRILGLFANEDMVDYGPDGVGKYAPRVPLQQMARKALDTLSKNPRGFFLFLEEEGTDGMSHENNAHGVIDAGRALDATIAEVMRFVRAHPDTLVVIGGDHETGGLSIENYDASDTDPDQDGPFDVPGSKLKFTVDWTTHDHTGSDTPVTAEGPGSARLGGTVENTDVYRVMRAASGL
ncbi:alkaline phosphatase [Amycolatopsis regifaucium]|uniref:Alkaline phosphatase n=1 Tax=Amycolatopsis regifaucium TaxID=546365 RepID=A0A154MP99_9PSEU|nr:alkaline phosphatase [Amycolatopsis regifaucium]KZB85803.1 alkaline phosphatase [Amycolatopsis regifaucium]OKA10442.1 alkaline phosphatase [Amycolatopsis regifaucium]SFI77104.1 alkaline phosphatase [Amycolatopsis regifaucium]